MQEHILETTQKFMKSLNKLATEQAEFPAIQTIVTKMKEEMSLAEKSSSSEIAKKLKPLMANLELEVHNIKHPTPNNELTISCPVTNEELYLVKNGTMKYLSEHGLCRKCNTDYHVTHLRDRGMQRCDWPIRYMGFICKSCWPEPSK